jgi:hypothetical protein
MSRWLSQEVLLAMRQGAGDRLGHVEACLGLVELGAQRCDALADGSLADEVGARTRSTPSLR